MFESSDPNTKVINATDSRFFWIALYAQPALWILLAVLAIIRLEFIWLTLVGRFDPVFVFAEDADDFSYCAEFDGHEYACLLEV